ncbi:MAG TPA: MATE family efflux transporter [Chthoniobacterales bacterium]|nr:MATE family efflux transporter [Chthoniobacterales bacterium]
MGSQRKLFLGELQATLALAVPMMIGQFGQMLMGITDTLVLGRVGVVPLAAIGFSNTLLSTLYVGGIGLLTSIGIFAAQAHGAKLEKEKVEVMRSALWLSMLAGAAAAAVICFLLPILRVFGQPLAIEIAARPYLAIVGLSLIFALGSMAAKTFCEALGKPVAPTLILYIGVVLNLMLNLPLVFGWMGIPALGLLGSAIATFASRLFVLVGTLAYALFLSQLKWSELALSRVDWHRVGSLFRVGLPICCQYLAEVGAFSLGAVMMGWIGTVALASHQVVLTCAATTFMFPLGISIAAGVRIGHAVGSQAYAALRRIAFGAIAISATIAASFAVIYLAAGRQVAGLFTSDQVVLDLAARLMIVAGAFQIADGIQVTAAGCLRGLADVRLPMLIGLFCYWAVAMPTAFVTAFMVPVGAIGVWIGFAAGLFVAATLLTWRLHRMTGPGIQDRFVFSGSQSLISD